MSHHEKAMLQGELQGEIVALYFEMLQEKMFQKKKSWKRKNVSGEMTTLWGSH